MDTSKPKLRAEGYDMNDCRGGSVPGMISLLAATWLLTGVAGRGLALGAESPVARARAGHVLFTMPEGWQRKSEDDGSVILTPPRAPEGQWYLIKILPTYPLKFTLREHVRQELRGMQFKGIQAGRIDEARHSGGYDIAITGVSMESGRIDGEFLYSVLFLAREGEKVQPIVGITNSAALYKQYANLLMEFTNSIRFTSLMVLAGGPPPLTQATVDEVTDFLEWVVEVPMTGGQREGVRQRLVDAWKKGEKDEINGVADILKLRTQLATATQSQSEVARQTIQPEVIKTWRKEQQTDAMSRMMLEIYDAGHKSIAPGNPPLTRQASDATLELAFFMACQAAGAGEIRPTDEDKNEWAKRLAAEYPKITAGARQILAQRPLAWAALRDQWPEIPAETRTALVASWAQDPQIKELAASFAKAARTSTANKPLNAADAMRRVEEHRANMKSYLDMGTMSHQTNMTINSNIGGSYHYEYRRR
jgi:hypothetical protein